MPAKTLTVASLSPARCGAVYIQTHFANGDAARLIQVSHAAECSRSESNGDYVVKVDGVVVGAVCKWSDGKWGFQALRAPNFDEISQYGEADRGARDLGVVNFLSSHIRFSAKSRRACLAGAGYAVI